MAPKVLDAKGNEIRVGSYVHCFPDTGIVRGFEDTNYGLRVQYWWLTGFHPDEPEPSERTEPVPGDSDTVACPNLRIIDSKTNSTDETEGADETEI
jgi:hypothetical protein